MKEVAAALAISPHTARHHTERVYTKLGLRSRVALALALGSPVGASSHSEHTTNDES
jgi:DNA-binding CsgD family transcriptional regulator